MIRPFLIGLAGGTGSGKTTASDVLVRAAAGQAAVVPQDAYYKDQPHVPLAEREVTNYDEPAAFDLPLLLQHIDALKASRAVERPVYDFAQHRRAPQTVALAPAPVLRARMDLKVFVDAPPDERFIRRMQRDVQERGRTPDSVIEQYRQTVKPMHDLFVQPSKQHADLIVPEGGRNEAAMAVLTAFVERQLGVPEVQTT
jgi:uridine kinase